jgi:hypothetical protein
MKVIAAAAEVIGVSPRYLANVAFIHFYVWDLAYLSRDLDGELGYGFAPTHFSSVTARISPAHLAVAQAFTHRVILWLKDANLEATFETLSNHQPEPYTLWRPMGKVSMERLRTLLMRTRAGAEALGLLVESEV